MKCRSWVFLVVGLTSATLFASGPCEKPCEKKPAPKERSCEKPCEKKPVPKERSCEKPPPCCECPPILQKPICLYETFDNEGMNLGVRGDVLYMIYNSPDLTYASDQYIDSNHILHSHILGVHGTPSVGCNIALNYTMKGGPGYTFETSWYHIVAQFSKSVTSDHVLLAHTVALNNSAPGTVSNSSHMTINLFDLLIKKQFQVGNWFTVVPAAGVVGGYLDATNHSSTAATSGSFTVSTPPSITAATLAYTNKFEGIGIKLGGDSSFKIWRGFKLQAEMFYSILYGFSKSHMDYSQNGLYLGRESGADTTFTHHHARSIFDSMLGLSWETRFACDSYYLNIHAGWRFQALVGGWREFEAEFDDSNKELLLSGQGLQAGATFKF